jgi:hypothetical protein
MSRILVPPSQIYSDLCTQALVLEDHLGKRFVLISCDLMMITAQTADEVKRRLRERFAISMDAVCVHAVHNHSCPPVVRQEAPSEEFFDPEYADFFLNQTVDVVGDALSRMAPARLRYCEDICTSVAINRRAKPDSNQPPALLPNNAGPVDFKVRVLVVEALSGGAPMSIVVEHAAHPVVTANSWLGADYPGYVRKWVSYKNPQATVIFVQGCDGNIRVRLLDKDRTGWTNGDPDVAEHLGRDLADAAERALLKLGTPVTGPISTKTEVVEVPLKRNEPPTTYPLRLFAVCLGTQTETPLLLLGIGAEAFVEYGLKIEEMLRPAHAIVLSYANDCAGYLPTAAACVEGGFEPNAWHDYYLLPGPYASDVESAVIRAAARLTARGESRPRAVSSPWPA